MRLHCSHVTGIRGDGMSGSSGHHDASNKKRRETSDDQSNIQPTDPGHFCLSLLLAAAPDLATCGVVAYAVENLIVSSEILL